MRFSDVILAPPLVLVLAVAACGGGGSSPGAGSSDELPAVCQELITKTHACVDKLTGAERNRALQGILMLEQGWHNPDNRPPDIEWQCQTLLARAKRSPSYTHAGCEF